MKLLVGLGNPGDQYAKTRHNIGFMVIEKVVEAFPVRALRPDKVMKLYQATIEGHDVLLVKPQTYMNLSGIAVREVLDRYQESPENLVVIYDDLDLDAGRLRIRRQGGHGGHKGMRSIIEHLDTRTFTRVRMGIGRPESSAIGKDLSDRDPVVEYVLQPFYQEEIPIMQETIKRAVEAIKLIVADQIEIAMNRYNRS